MKRLLALVALLQLWTTCLASTLDAAQPNYTTTDQPVFWSRPDDKTLQTGTAHIAFDVRVISPCALYTKLHFEYWHIDIIHDYVNKTGLDELCRNKTEEAKWREALNDTCPLVVNETEVKYDWDNKSSDDGLESIQTTIVGSVIPLVGFRQTSIVGFPENITAAGQIQLDFQKQLVQEEVARIRQNATAYKSAHLTWRADFKSNGTRFVRYFSFGHIAAASMNRLFPGLDLCPNRTCASPRFWKPEGCTRLSDERIIFRITATLTDSRVELFQAKPLNIYVAQNETGTVCKFTYSGPKYIGWNRARNCTQTLELMGIDTFDLKEKVPLVNSSRCDADDDDTGLGQVTPIHYQPHQCIPRNQLTISSYPTGLLQQVLTSAHLLMYCNYLTMIFPSNHRLNCSNSIYILPRKTRVRIYDPLHNQDESSGWMFLLNSFNISIDDSARINRAMRIPPIGQLRVSLEQYQELHDPLVWKLLDRLAMHVERHERAEGRFSWTPVCLGALVVLLTVVLVVGAIAYRKLAKRVDDLAKWQFQVEYAPEVNANESDKNPLI